MKRYLFLADGYADLNQTLLQEITADQANGWAPKKVDPVHIEPDSSGSGFTEVAPPSGTPAVRITLG